MFHQALFSDTPAYPENINWPHVCLFQVLIGAYIGATLSSCRLLLAEVAAILTDALRCVLLRARRLRCGAKSSRDTRGWQVHALLL